MMLLKRTLFYVFGVMQCVYVVRGSKTHYFPHTVHYCCSSMLRLRADFYKAHRSEKRGVL